MKYGTIPYIDKPISKIVCGSDFLAYIPEDQAYAAMDAFWESGGRCFDSAHCYGKNSNILGDWVAARGVAKEVVFLDKGCHPYDRKRVTYEDMGNDIRENHERLGVGYTDLFVLHRDDPEVPVKDIVEWLNAYKADGLIGAFGGSNWHHSRIAAANDYASKAGLQPLSLSNPNLTLAKNNRPLWEGCVTIDREGRQWHQATQFPLFSWSSMARGYFAHTDDDNVNAAYDNEVSKARRLRAEELGTKRGVSGPSIAMAWVLNQPFPVYALAGLRSPDQVRDTLKALDIQLSQQELAWLEDGPSD
jgi:aryl-alcohol dehydrogenase-like predicted oxidoreductase